MSEFSQEEARRFIAEVREVNGGITAEDRDFLLAERPSALRALQNTRRQLADSIKIVVNNLYSKETRFLYELIQNAEDNSYSTVTANGEEPFLAFKVYPDRIIIESNEDGFSESDIRAICSVGNSTKKHSAGYIGEKGIGFKSVFKVAQKVHIHSGPFSFAFSHTREDDDDGLGMITPYHEDAQELPHGVRTRMSLTLLDSTKFEERAAEFCEVPDTLLMFLSQLQRLSIELYQPGNDSTTTQYSKRETKENGLYTTFLTKTTRKGMEESTLEQKYYTTKSELHNLPFDEARKDKRGDSIDSATVILAFPVDEYDKPVIKSQYTYAFLPLRRVGFKFLIQADFVTAANREDVVHSKRNQAVLRGVARAFADAIIVFCEHPWLMYQWMRYLPEDLITHEFWGTLWDLIRVELEQTPLLESWSGRGLYKPSDLERVPKKFLTKDQRPLLPDLKGAEVYLSPQYTEADFQILKRLGTKSLQWSKIIDRLDADLRNPSGSKWRLIKNDEWRTQICNLLQMSSTKNLSNHYQRLRTLALVPLRDDIWVSSFLRPKIYFPKTNGIPIPTDLGLDLVCPLAVENVAWVGLLSDLGTMSCPQQVVISLIRKRYDSINLANFKLFNAVAHIRYLYSFLPKEHSSLLPQVRLANQHGSLLKNDQYLYFPDEGDDYSPAKLFQQDAHHPGHPVNYLHKDYLEAVDTETVHNGRQWTRWLEETFSIRRIPELRAKSHNGLSKEFQYIVGYRSNRLLGTLKRGWAYYRPQFNNILEGELRNSSVLLENGRRTSLLSTYMPFPKLKQIAAELCIADAYPFIAMSELIKDEEILDWIFVKDLQIGIEDGLAFYLSALKTFKKINPAPKSTSAKDQLVRIYQNIQSKCSEGLDCVRVAFRYPVIWIQPSHRIDSTWLSTADCVWDGPQWLKSKQCLKPEAYQELEHLFKVSLKIPNASQADVVNDLLMLKNNCGEKNALRSQQQNVGTTNPPYQVISKVETFNTTSNLHSITSMEAYENQSFEELRLQDYYRERKPLSPETPVYKMKAFAGLKSDDIIEEVEKRYDYLWEQCSHPIKGENRESRDALHFTFEESALVYIPKQKAWRPPSQCVWVDSSVKIPWKASIADSYTSKENFFTTVLKISKPTVEMYVDSLKAEARGEASAAQIKETMALICRLGIGATDLSSLVADKVLPVKLANGESSFTAAFPEDNAVHIAIVDNIIHWNAFKGKIAVLDFSLEEIRDTKPLLLALGMGKLFSSKLVKEITDVREGSQNHEMTRNFRTKSHALARCAFHFASLSERQDVAPLYRRFKRAIVYVSDGIRRLLQITQRGRSIEGASSRANFHIEEAEGALRLYLPKDEVECDVCFESDLPRKLCTFLSITDPDAPGVIGAVFRKNNPVVVDKILESAGVGQVDCDFAALDEELGTPEAGLDCETLVEATSRIRLSTPSAASRPYTPSGWARRGDRQSGSKDAEDVHNIIPSPSYQEQLIDAQETAYKRVLEQVVNLARQRVNPGTLESAGLSIGDPVTIGALPQSIIQKAFATGSQERDLFKIGAAGELYVFEYLKGLGLPGFDLENWKSAIRDRVKLHGVYYNIKKSKDRRAIADIEYLDKSHKLTQYLTQRGHLAQPLSYSEKPLYHIEVKTTTLDWREPFYMSKAQERHIQDKRIEDGRSYSSIYIICRIFNLGQGDETGMHVYLDPETKRRNGELEFSTHTWAVKPLMHPSRPFGNADTKTGAGDKVPSITADFVSGSSDRIFGSLLPRSQNQTESPRDSLFRSSSATSNNNANPQPPPKSSIFGTSQSSSTTGFFSRPNSKIFNDTPVSPFGSNVTSSNRDVSEAAPKGGLDESNPFSTSNDNSKASSTGKSVNNPTSTDASKDVSPSTTGLFGFGLSSNTTSEASSTGSIFDTRAIRSSDGKISEPNPPSSKLKTTDFYSYPFPSSTSTSSRLEKLGTKLSSGNTQVTKSTAVAGFSFGTAAKSTDSRPSQGASPFSGLRTSSSTPQGAFGSPSSGLGFTTQGAFGTQASTPTSQNIFGSTKPIHTASSPFGTPLSSTNTSDTTSTSKSTKSTAPGTIARADSASTGNVLPNTFQASGWNMDSSLAHPSPSPSPAPRTNSRSLQARGFGGGASPGPEAATLVAEEQLNATGNETLDEMMETLDSYKLPSDDETE